MISNTERRGPALPAAAVFAGQRNRPPDVTGMDVERLLGVGSASTVWLARVSGPGPTWTHQGPPPEHMVALKVAGDLHPAVPVSDASDGGGAVAVRRRLHAELDAMVPLRHDHLVSAYGWASTTQGPALVLEAFTAGSLGRILSARGALTPGQVVTVLSPIAQALAHIHRAGVAHGDVSTGNVLLAPDGRPALSDLGDAQLLGMPRPAAGTPGFLAPEREDALRGIDLGRFGAALEGSLAPESDVYSLAAVVWSALTGTAPRRSRDRPPLGALCPEAGSSMIELLEAALSETPRDRPEADELAWELHRCTPSEPLDLTPHADDEVLPDLPTVRRPAGSGVSARARSARGSARSGRRRISRRAGGLLGIGVAAVMGTAGLSLLVVGSDGEDSSSTRAVVEDQDATGSAVGTQTPLSQLPGDTETLGLNGESAPTPGAGSLMHHEDPIDALSGLAALRTAELRAPDQGDPGGYTVSGSPAEAAEIELLQDLTAAEMSYEGELIRIEPTSPVIVSEAGEGPLTVEQARVDVLVQAEGYAGTGWHAQHVQLVLHRSTETEGAWLLYSVDDTDRPE